MPKQKLLSFYLIPVALTLGLSSSPVVAEEVDTRQYGFQSGYGDEVPFGGPDSVSGELKKNDINRDSIYQFDVLQTTFKPYFDWKRDLNKKYGLKLGFNIF